MGTNSKIKWTARNCLFSLIKISDLNTLLRPRTLTRLSRGATCLLSAKTFEEKNYGQHNKITDVSEQNIKRRKEYEVEGLLPMLQEKRKNRRDLNLGYPIWLSLSDWAVKTIIPCPRGYQEVILHTLIGFGEARDESNNG